MKEIRIFKNYGCLAAEKRVIYTYGAEAETAVCSDEITVGIPDGWEVYKTVSGEIVCETPWGGGFGINQLLEGNERPCFSAYDNNGKLHRIQLKVIE